MLQMVNMYERMHEMIKTRIKGDHSLLLLKLRKIIQQYSLWRSFEPQPTFMLIDN